MADENTQFEALVTCFGHFTFTKGEIVELSGQRAIDAVEQKLVKPVSAPAPAPSAQPQSIQRPAPQPDKGAV